MPSTAIFRYFLTTICSFTSEGTGISTGFRKNLRGKAGIWVIRDWEAVETAGALGSDALHRAKAGVLMRGNELGWRG